MSFVFDEPQNNTPGAAVEIRTNLNALGVTNFTTDANLPANPREGMARINASNSGVFSLEYFLNGDWRVAFANLSVGQFFAQRQEFNFTTAASIWTCDHNLGRKPIVQVVNSIGRIITPSIIEHTNSDNRVVVTHGTSITGTVIVLG